MENCLHATAEKQELKVTNAYVNVLTLDLERQSQSGSTTFRREELEKLNSSAASLAFRA